MYTHYSCSIHVLKQVDCDMCRFSRSSLFLSLVRVTVTRLMKRASCCSVIFSSLWFAIVTCYVLCLPFVWHSRFILPHTHTHTHTHAHARTHTHARTRTHTHNSAEVLADAWRRGPADRSWSVFMHDCFAVELTGEWLKCLFRLTRDGLTLVV